LKNFKISGVTDHAIRQALTKKAPILRPKKIKKLIKKGEIRPAPAAGSRNAFIYEDMFVYITNRSTTVVITVLTWREYKTIMYS
jgi:hypothetical protein